MTTLTVTIGESDRIERETVRRIRRAERDDEVLDDRPVLNFEDYETLARFLTEANLELLDAIAAANPPSIRQTAELVDRDYREVHRNLTDLEALGVVRFEGDGQGTAKRPVVAYDAVEISFSLGDDSETKQDRASP